MYGDKTYILNQYIIMQGDWTSYILNQDITQGDRTSYILNHNIIMQTQILLRTWLHILQVYDRITFYLTAFLYYILFCERTSILVRMFNLGYLQWRHRRFTGCSVSAGVLQAAKCGSSSDSFRHKDKDVYLLCLQRHYDKDVSLLYLCEAGFLSPELHRPVNKRG